MKSLKHTVLEFVKVIYKLNFNKFRQYHPFVKGTPGKHRGVGGVESRNTGDTSLSINDLK